MKDIDLICKLNKDWRPDNIKIKKAGGQTNRNYIVQCKTKKFFIRLPWERADIVNREAEAKNILAEIRAALSALKMTAYFTEKDCISGCLEKKPMWFSL